MSRWYAVMVGILLCGMTGAVFAEDAPPVVAGKDAVPPAKVAIERALITPSENAVLVRWTAGTEEDLAGYNVYRSTMGKTGKEEQVKLNKDLITKSETSFLDKTVKRGVQYMYAIKAVDTAGNTSEISKQVGVPLLRILDRAQKISHDWDDGDTPVPGATIAYKIDFANEGYTDAHNIVFEDYIPENTTYVYHSSDCSVPATLYFWVTSLNDGAGGWTDKEPKKTTTVTRVKWVLKNPVSPVKTLGGLSGTVRYSVLINYI